MNRAQFVEHVAFDQPTESADGYGGVTLTFAEAYTCRAAFQYLRGGETVQAERLAGRQPLIAIIRSNSLSRTITPQWRMRDLNSGKVFNIASVEPTRDRRYLHILAQGGTEV